MKVKTTLKLSEVGRHPLLQPDKIDGVLTYFPQRQNEYPLAQLMPLVNVNTDKVQMDVEKVSRGGMAPMVSLGSESPIYGQWGGMGYEEFEAAEFREKVILSEQDLYNLREIGTKEDLVQARDLLRRKFSALEVRLLNRLEWMRRQVMFGGTVTATTASGVPFSLDYHHPSYLEKDSVASGAGAYWNDAAASDPMYDLQVWVEEFMLHSGFTVDRVILPLGTFRLLSQNEKFRELMKYTGSFELTREMITRHIADLIGVGRVEEWPASLQFATETVQDAATGDNSLRVRNIDELASGDKVVVYDGLNKRKQQLLTVDGVNSVTKEVSFAELLELDLVKGAPLRYSKYTIPRDQLLIVGRVDGPLSTEGQGARGPDASTLSGFADVCSTLSRYTDLENARPGVFTKMIDKTDGDPPHIEEVLGIRALPRVHYSEAWMTAKIRGDI